MFVSICVIHYHLKDNMSSKSRNLELIALEIQKPNSKPFLFTAWYRPPKLDSQCFKYFELLLEKVEPKYITIIPFALVGYEVIK